MISRVSPKAGIYFSHYECFGHTSRVMAVGEVFKKRFPFGDLFFIQAGVGQPKAKIDQLGRVYSLPGLSWIVVISGNRSVGQGLMPKSVAKCVWIPLPGKGRIFL